MELPIYAHDHDHRPKDRKKANKSGSLSVVRDYPKNLERTAEVPFRASGFANVIFIYRVYLRPF